MLTAVSGESAAHLHCTGFEVYVLPAQGQQLPLPQAGLGGHDVERLQPVAPYRIQKLACLLVGQGTYLFFVYLRRVHVVRYVAWYEPPTYRLLERFVQNDVQFADRGVAQAGVELGTVEALHVSRIQGLQLLPAQRRDQMLAAQRLVPVEGALADGAANGVFESTL